MCRSVQDAVSSKQTDLCETLHTDTAHYVVPPPPSVRVGAEAPAAGGRVAGWSSTPPAVILLTGTVLFFGDTVKCRSGRSAATDVQQQQWRTRPRSRMLL